MNCLKFLFAALLTVLPSLSLAMPYYGIKFSYALVGTEPLNLHAYQLMLSYDPQQFKWRQFNIYFDGGFSHFWENNSSCYSSIDIYSLAPVIHYDFKHRGLFVPYIELSIGLAYLNHSHIDDRNLGIHFAFQDRIGIGVSFGQAQQFSLGLHAMHYSNAHFSEHNSGISTPVVLDIGYRF